MSNVPICYLKFVIIELNRPIGQYSFSVLATGLDPIIKIYARYTYFNHSEWLKIFQQPIRLIELV